MTDFQILVCAVAGLACFVIGYLWASESRMRKLKCLLGFHAPDSRLRNEGTYLVQRCLYCDRVMIKMEAKDNHIRRIQ